MFDVSTARDEEGVASSHSTQNESQDANDAARILGGQLGARLKIIAPTDAPFEFRSSSLNLPELRIITTALTPCQIIGGRGELPSLILPLEGRMSGWRGRKEFGFAAEQNGLLLPAMCARSGACDGPLKAITITFVADRLEQTARAMIGLKGQRDDGEDVGLLRLHEPTELLLRYGRFDFMALFNRLMSALLDIGKIPNFLAKSGLEDCVYRAIALLLLPERVIDVGGKGVERPSYLLERICQYIVSNLADGVNMADLQQYSGLSARAIQYAFRRDTGMTPMQWIQEQKLIAVRSALLNAHAGQTVTDLASAYFGNLGDFARRYRARFGELPSATLTRATFKK